jgi:uncharacterized protein with von Willebrand factor type A (vWA) domain
MGLLDDLLGKAQDLLGRQRKRGTATDAVKYDRFDAAVWEELKEAAPALGNAVREMNKKYDYTDELLRDVCMEFFKSDPQMRGQDEMDERYLANHSTVKHIHEAPDTVQARTYTKHDKYGAAMATIGCGQALREHLDKAKELQEAAESADSRERDFEGSKDELMEVLDGLGDDPGDEQVEALANDVARAEADLSHADEGWQDLEKEKSRVANQLRAPVQQAVTEAAKALDEENQMMAAWGKGPGELQRMSFEERRALAQRLRSNRLAKFVKLLGRWRFAESATRAEKVEYGRDEVIGVELSADVSQLASPELVNLVDPVLRMDFYRRFAEGQLMTRKYIGNEKAGQGSIIFCLDCSGSMGMANTGASGGVTREVWGKAFALALLARARSEGRDFVGILFADSQRDLKVFRFPASEGDNLDRVLEFTETFTGGGTDYQLPLATALQIMHDEFNAAGKAKADLVFVSDGECALPTQFMAQYLEVKRRLGFRTFSIGIGYRFKEGGPLAAIGDDVRSVTEFLDPEAVGDILRLV